MFETMHCPQGASSIDYKKVNVRAYRTACILGMQSFNWDVAQER